MKKEYLKIFRCPFSKEKLNLEITELQKDIVISGKLFSSKFSYPITNGIPRFVNNEGYSSNFGWQWNKWAKVQFEDENIGKPMEGHTSSMFKKITELSYSKLKNKVICDIGCGPGRFVDIAQKLSCELVVAVDYSSAIDVSKKNFALNDKNILFVQADALNLPFKNNVFDYAYSIGVLHHTPNPAKGVNEAKRILKKNGEFALSVYRKGGYYDLPTVQALRKTFNFLWPIFGPYAPYLYSQIFGRLNHYINKLSKKLGLLFRVIFAAVPLRDVKWSILDTFDSITPSYQSSHRLYEVAQWFKKARFREIRIAAWENIIGKK
jgi:ubiquinone/menaquinone biosynthesis C-methylase UbiE/uncharacterized protein YbaR (Trm112 family)